MFRLALILVALVAAVSASPVPEIFRGGRIVGGQAAVLGQFPYQASLRTAANFHFCGGVIISNQWVLSAAHCTIGRAQTAVHVVVGTILLNAGGVVHQSAQIINHPDYNSQWISNDVSVIRTAALMTLNANVQPVALGSSHVGGGVNAIVSGWGGTAVTGGPAPNNLQWVTTTTLTNADCRARHTAGNAQFVFDHKICTFTIAGQGICQGDSGGPLVAAGQVIGTVSWNIPCARGWPDAFDRTHYFRSWITQHTGIQ
jgi:trypsin